jgi:drug/metabolite transporter (DMT)-like permease
MNPTMQLSRLRLVLVLAAGIVAISFASVLIRMAQAEGVPTLSIAAWRLIFASVVLSPFAWFRRRSEILDLSRREWLLLGGSGLCLALHFATWIGSLGHTSVASSVVLVSMGPLFVGLGSWILLGERPGLRLALGILLAAAGSVVIGWGDQGQGEDRLLGDVLALAGAAMVAAYWMIGRVVRGRRSLTTYIGLVYGMAALTLITIVAVGRQPMFGFRPAAYGWMLTLGLIPQLVGHSTLNWALSHLSATFVAILTLAEPIGSGLLAYLILGEKVTVLTLVGGAVVLAGIYLASRAELRGQDSRRRDQ